MLPHGRTRSPGTTPPNIVATMLAWARSQRRKITGSATLCCEQLTSDQFYCATLTVWRERVG